MNIREKRFIAIIALVIVVILMAVIIRTNNNHHIDNRPPGHTTDTHLTNNRSPHDMTVSSEQEFLSLMIPHHQEAVDAAKEVLSRPDTTPGVKQLAETIIAQQTEIDAIKAWYETWYGTPYVYADTYEPMMRDLIGIEGVAVDRMFLTDMIAHHESAITMANSVKPYVTHSETSQLADTIIATQQAEIDHMNDLSRALE